MADNKNERDARRWFRWHLTELGTQYPHLKHPARQERLADALHQQGEEETICHENPQADHAADQ
jgi:hypothetical protein